MSQCLRKLMGICFVGFQGPSGNHDDDPNSQRSIDQGSILIYLTPLNDLTTYRQALVVLSCIRPLLHPTPIQFPSEMLGKPSVTTEENMYFAMSTTMKAIFQSLTSGLQGLPHLMTMPTSNISIFRFLTYQSH